MGQHSIDDKIPASKNNNKGVNSNTSRRSAFHGSIEMLKSLSPSYAENIQEAADPKKRP